MNLMIEISLESFETRLIHFLNNFLIISDDHRLNSIFLN